MARRKAAVAPRQAGFRVRPELEHLAVPIDSLRPHPKNPRNGDIDLIAESLRFHGQYRPIVVRAQTGEILAGNHTYAAAMQLGWTVIAATKVECDDDQAMQIMLMDNRSGDKARYDDGQLSEILSYLDHHDLLDGSGWGDDELQKLIDRTTEAGDQSGQLPETWQILVTCRDEAEQRDLLAQLSDAGVQVKALVA